jgi:hypothetical protein
VAETEVQGNNRQWLTKVEETCFWSSSAVVSGSPVNLLAAVERNVLTLLV